MKRDHILIIEDERAIRESVQDLLELNNYRVSVAGDGKAGLEALKDDMPDLILSDVRMPGMDGFELLRELRNNTDTELVPVILLTAKVELESKLRGLEIGADDYITKPFEFKELALKISNLLRTRKKLISKTGPANSSEPVSQDSIFIKKLNLLLNEQLDNSKLRIESVAFQLNLSLSTFQRKLKNITGKSPNQYIKEHRLLRARTMINVNYGNLSEIARQTGFGSLSYFSKAYKDFFGTTPSDDYPEKIS